MVQIVEFVEVAMRTSGWLARHALAAYFGLAFLFAWALFIPLALRQQGLWGLQVPLALHYAASFAPGLAALILTGLLEGRAGLLRLGRGLLRWRADWRLWLVGVGGPLLLFGIALAWQWLSNGAAPAWDTLGEVDYLPRPGVLGALLLWLLTFGLGEEVGWRGFALPRLQARHGALTAALWLSVPWALWHLPAFFYRDTYAAMGLAAGLPMLWLSILAATVVLSWLYNSSEGSILLCVLFHGLFDWLSVSPAGGPAAPSIMSAAVMIGALALVWRYGPRRLSAAAAS